MSQNIKFLKRFLYEFTGFDTSFSQKKLILIFDCFSKMKNETFQLPILLLFCLFVTGPRLKITLFLSREGVRRDW